VSEAALALLAHCLLPDGVGKGISGYAQPSPQNLEFDEGLGEAEWTI
jgi:hypothetical protein